VPHATRDKENKNYEFLITGLSPSMVQDSAASSNQIFTVILFKNRMKNLSHNPKFFNKKFGLGCSQFARRYYGNRVCFFFL